MTDPQDLPAQRDEVTQADRDAAADFLESWEPGPEMTVVKLARAFAKHRRADLASQGGASAPGECRLRSALEKAALQFRIYEVSHKNKKTDDGDAKAATNRMMAEMCEAALAGGEALDPETTAQRIYEAMGYVNWITQPDTVKDRWRVGARAALGAKAEGE